jgi:hypothetical protein
LERFGRSKFGFGGVDPWVLFIPSCPDYKHKSRMDGKYRSRHDHKRKNKNKYKDEL